MSVAGDARELWFIDDVPMNTFGYDIMTWGGNRQSPPQVRGNDMVVPYRPGTIWVPKTMDSRTLTLEFWVQGSDPISGIVFGVPPTNGALTTFRQNWRILKRTFFQPNRQFVLTKHFYDDLTDSTIIASANAAFASGLELVAQTSTHYTFTVDITLSDGRFFTSGGITIGPGTSNVGGDIFTNSLTATIPVGATLTNTTTGRGLTNNDPSFALILNCLTFESGGGNPGNLVVTGPPGPWFWLEPGENVLTGSGSVIYSEAWA